MKLPANPKALASPPDLSEQLQGWWAQDRWELANCPLLNGKGFATSQVVEFNCQAPNLNVELKYGCWRKLAQRDWSITCWSGQALIAHLVDWLNSLSPPVHSLMDYPLDKWLFSLRTYLLEHGLLHTTTGSYLDRTQTPRLNTRNTLLVCTFRQIYLVVQQAYDQRPEYERDIWDLRHLGVNSNPATSDYKLNFTHLTQAWLLKAAKAFMRYSLAGCTGSTCRRRLAALTPFSNFLQEHYPELSSAQLNRKVLLEYLAELATSGVAATTWGHHLAHLRIFLELCSQEGWAAVPDKRLIYDEDFPLQPKVSPRFIPATVLAQLNQHLPDFAEPLRSMIYLLRECGMRISELLALPFDCLSQDASGDWFLRYYQYKLKKEHTIPISLEIAVLVQTQQERVRTKWSNPPQFLFPNPKGNCFKERGFINTLNRAAVLHNIRDSNGQLYRFQAHQFRHTLATQMINNGVPQHIVQRFLGHESPEMTMRYAHIHDQTLKEAYFRFQGRMVNVAGEVVGSAGESEVNSPDLQWLKQNILAQALPNGYCVLPVVAGPCPHANACLTCTHLRTDAGFLSAHRIQLQQTEQILEVARANHWQRQIEMNERVRENLRHIIERLEPPKEEPNA